MTMTTSIPLDTGRIEIPDTVEEFLARCGKNGGELQLVGDRHTGRFRKDKNVILHTWEVSPQATGMHLFSWEVNVLCTVRFVRFIGGDEQWTAPVSPIVRMRSGDTYRLYVLFSI